MPSFSVFRVLSTCFLTNTRACDDIFTPEPVDMQEVISSATTNPPVDGAVGNTEGLSDQIQEFRLGWMYAAAYARR